MRIPYKNKVFEIYGFYMWKNNAGVSRIEYINGAIIKHTMFDLNGKWLSEGINTLDYFYENTKQRVQPKVR